LRRFKFIFKEVETFAKIKRREGFFFNYYEDFINITTTRLFEDISREMKASEMRFRNEDFNYF
jgi:hypothetical protein